MAVSRSQPPIRPIAEPVDFHFEEEPFEPNGLVVTVAGELDIATIPPVRDALNAALATGIDGVPAAPLVSRDMDSEGDEERTALESTTLERTAARIRLLELTVDTRVVIDARPAHAIVDFASRHHIDLIAMTTHGRGALQRLVAGSVAEAVLHTASAHMLLYRPQNPAPS